jgi:hypothetical protein
LIGPHLKQTREAAGQQSQVLLIQDTTDLDYQAHPTTTGLGPIGTGSHQGLLLQTVLAVLPARREVLGIAQQEPFLRQPAPKGETKRQRQERERESQIWERSFMGTLLRSSRYVFHHALCYGNVASSFCSSSTSRCAQLVSSLKL